MREAKAGAGDCASKSNIFPNSLGRYRSSWWACQRSYAPMPHSLYSARALIVDSDGTLLCSPLLRAVILYGARVLMLKYELGMPKKGRENTLGGCLNCTLSRGYSMAEIFICPEGCYMWLNTFLSTPNKFLLESISLIFAALMGGGKDSEGNMVRNNVSK